MKLDVPNELNRPMQSKLKIEYKTELKTGDIVQILDQDKNILELAYVDSEVQNEHGMPLISLVSQKTGIKFSMVVTNAIQKI